MNTRAMSTRPLSRYPGVNPSAPGRVFPWCPAPSGVHCQVARAFIVNQESAYEVRRRVAARRALLDRGAVVRGKPDGLRFLERRLVRHERPDPSPLGDGSGRLCGTENPAFRDDHTPGWYDI